MEQKQAPESTTIITEAVHDIADSFRFSQGWLPLHHLIIADYKWSQGYGPGNPMVPPEMQPEVVARFRELARTYVSIGEKSKTHTDKIELDDGGGFAPITESDVEGYMRFARFLISEDDEVDKDRQTYMREHYKLAGETDQEAIARRITSFSIYTDYSMLVKKQEAGGRVRGERFQDSQDPLKHPFGSFTFWAYFSDTESLREGSLRRHFVENVQVGLPLFLTEMVDRYNLKYSPYVAGNNWMPTYFLMRNKFLRHLPDWREAVEVLEQDYGLSEIAVLAERIAAEEVGSPSNL